MSDGPWSDFAPPAAPAAKGPWEDFAPTPTPTASVSASPKSGGSLLGSAAAIGDMFLSLPGQAIGWGAEVGTRLRGATAQLLGHPEYTHHMQGIMGQQAGEKASAPFTNPLHKLMDALGYGKDYDHSQVEQAMGWLQKKQAEGGEAIEKATGGKFTKEDFDLLINTVTLGLGGRAADFAAGKIGEKAGKPDRTKFAQEPSAEPSPAEVDPALARLHAERANRETFDAQGPQPGEPPRPLGQVHGAAADLEAAKATAPGAEFPKRPSDVAGARERLNPNKVDSTPPRTLTPNPPTILDAIPEKGIDAVAKEVSDWEGEGGRLNPEAGKAKPEQLALLAAFGVGGLLANQIAGQPSLANFLVGGVLGVAALKLGPRDIVTKTRAFFEKDPRLSVGGLANTRQARLDAAGIDLANMTRGVQALVPDSARRAAISEAIDKSDLSTLSGIEQKTARQAVKYFSDMTALASRAGVLDAAERAYQKLADGSTDISHRMAAFGRAVTAAIENKRFLEAAKAARGPTGTPLVMGADKAPQEYVSINAPGLQGLRIHPDIEGQVRFVFDNPSSRGVVAAMGVVSDFLKRNAVTASLFHAKALVDALIGAGKGKPEYLIGATIGAAVGAALDPDHPMRGAVYGATAGYVAKRLASYVKGENAYLNELKKGTASPLVDEFTKAGLKVSVDRGELSVEDAGRSFYGAMEVVQKTADEMFRPAGYVLEKYVQANHAIDGVMWNRLHAGMKINIWAEKRAQLMENSLKAHEADPRVRVLSREEAGEIAARFTNSVFGGLNWTRLAMDAQTRLGRTVGEWALSPKGRRVMQIAMFAPDWTISTAMAAFRAVDKDLANPVRVVKGLRRPLTEGDLHRQYVARSALYYLVAADAINVTMSGHHIWENKDWSYIDWGGGRRMQWSKHIMEAPHWFKHPVQQALGKMGTIPKEGLNQAMGTEYLAPRLDPRSGSVTAGPGMKEGRLEHARNAVSPISLQQGLQGGGDIGSFASGFLGVPILGQTEEQRAEARREERRRKKEKEYE